MSRKLKKFRLDELSFVDRPAQEGATAVIAKARDIGRGCVVVQSPTPMMRLVKVKKSVDREAVRSAVLAILRDKAKKDHELTDEEAELVEEMGIDSDLPEDEIHEQIEEDVEAHRAAEIARAKLERKERQMSKFMTHTIAIQKRDGCTRTEAMAKARREHPEDYEEYQANADRPQVREAPPTRKARFEKSTFEKKVDEIHAANMNAFNIAKGRAGPRDPLPRRPSRADAMSKARQLRPDLFALYQANADRPEFRGR